MSYEDIDNFIIDLDQSARIPLGPASVSFLVLKKLASDGVDDAREQFAAPVEDVAAGLAQVIAYEFQKESSASLEYLLGELRSLSPQGFRIPGPVEKTAGLQEEIALEQQSLVAMEKLCHLVGEGAPLYHTLRHLMKVSENCLSKAKAKVPAPKKKTAANHLLERLQKSASEDKFMKMAQKIKKDQPAAQPAQDIVVPPPNSDTPDAYVARERQLQLDQAIQELAHTKMQLNETSMVAQQAQQEGQEAQSQLQEMDQQLQETRGMVEEANQSSQAHQQQAIEAETRAAQHATQKMQLGMRVQQMRQALAEIATQDPVTETASGASDLAAQGAPATPDQIAQDQMAQQQAAEQQAMAGSPPPAKAKKEVDQAERAAQEAEQQGAQAAVSGGPAAQPAAPAGTPAIAPAPGGMAAA